MGGGVAEGGDVGCDRSWQGGVCVTPLIVVSGCLAKPFGPVLVTAPVVRVT